MKTFFLSLEDFDVEEEDEEALIEQRRIQRQAIVQVCDVPSRARYSEAERVVS